MKNNNIKVDCTWGEGIDIILSSDKCSVLSITPGKSLDKITNWQLDLTKEQAAALIVDLRSAIKEIENLEAICADHDRIMEKNYQDNS